MPKLLIVFAHPLEAAPTIKALKAHPVHPDHLYEFDHGHILISGLGPIAGAAQTAAKSDDCDEIWNFGLAGALQTNIPVGEVREAASVAKHLSLPPTIDYHSMRLSETSHPPITLHPVGWKLVSATYPVWDRQLREELSAHYDIVDMEGYGIATAAAARGIPCRLFKIISDHAHADEWQEMRARIEKLAHNLAEVVLRELNLR